MSSENDAAAVKSEEDVPSQPKKEPIVEVQEESSVVPAKAESRGEAAVAKREETQESRDEAKKVKKAPVSPGRFGPPPPPVQQNPSSSSNTNSRNNSKDPSSSQHNNHPHHLTARGRQHQGPPHQHPRFNLNPPIPNMNGGRLPFPGAMGRGYGAPPYGYPPPGGNFGQMPPQYHPHHPMMQPGNFNQGGFPPPNMKNSFPPMPPYGYGMQHGYPPPPHHPAMNFHSNNPPMNEMMNNSSNNSSSNASNNSNNGARKKRTIDGVHSNNPMNFNPYAFRRTDSSSTATSTVNNTTSTEPLPQQQSRHRRNYSGASTASSLSVGGFSINSYERNNSTYVTQRWHFFSPLPDEDQVMGDKSKYSPKRQRKNTLSVDTNMRPPSSLLQPVDTQEQSSRFEQLSIDARRPTSTDSGSSNQSNLFLSLSTSPINADVDSTPNMKNTSKPAKSQAIFKSKNQDRPTDTPTPPVHGELGDSSMLNDEHTMLNSHLRGQSFTPLPHLSASTSAIHDTTSPSNALQPQLSWSIAGDTPSLGDLDEWDEDSGKIRLESTKSRPNSATSTESKAMSFSPHEFQMWKEEHDLADGNSGTTTPLPIFFEQSGNEGTENKFGDQTNKNRRQGGDGHGIFRGSNKKMEPTFWKHDGIPGMPPTPVFEGSEYHNESFPAHSPMHGERHDQRMDYTMAPYAQHNDRIRNLRGRVHPGYPPMPIHIPPHMSAHLPLASPMGIGKGGMWSPHHGIHLGSPHHLGSPLNAMAQSKRKCIPLKPPIPSKFQGDMEKVKNSPVPEFTSLVNFPSHMSQKQAVNLPEGMRCCVMCGQACPCSSGNKTKKSKMKGMDGGLAPRSSNGQDHLGDKSSGYAIIPTQNKGLCTLCDVNVWVVSSSGLEIKWCKGCKNFRPWAAFGDKGLATKCLRCRERQREKYALQKEEKEKARLLTKKQPSK